MAIQNRGSQTLCLGWLAFTLSQFLIIGLYFRPEFLWDASINSGQSAIQSQQLTQAQKDLQRAFTLAQTFQPQDGRTTLSLYLLASTALRQGHVKDGEALLIQAQTFQHQHGGPEDLLAGVIDAQLSSIALRKGELLQARTLSEQAITTLKRQAELNFPPRIQAEATLGLALAASSQRQKALPHLQFALDQINAQDPKGPTMSYLRKPIEQEIASSRQAQPLRPLPRRDDKTDTP